MKYAVFSSGGRQYKASVGDELLLDGYAWGEEDKKTFELGEVYLIAEGDKVVVGTPQVTGAKVAFEVLGLEKGEKINVRKYKAKSRYRRAIGHRSQYTRVKVTAITS